MDEPRYSELHLFVDETGRLTTDSDRLNAVGGVLFLGRYDSNTDTEIKDILQRRYEEVDADFPTDLHYSQSDMSRGQIRHCLERVGSDLARLYKERPLQAIHGVSATHELDAINNTGSLLLAEDMRDNRYRTLLWSLIEHLVFVAPSIRRCLADNWTLHLHVASRTIALKKSQTAERRAFEQAGYHVQGRIDGRDTRDNETPDRYLVHKTLNERDLEQMLRDALRLRWNQLPVKIGSLDVNSLDYDDASSPAGLYLADLYLGQFRGRELHDGEITILEPFADLRYGPWMNTVAEMAAATMQENLERYLTLRDRFDAFEHNAAATLKNLVSHYDSRVAPLLKNRPERLEKELKEASEEADTPGRTSSGFQRARRAYRFLDNIDAVTDRARLLYLQTALSHANHTGNTAKADELWTEFEQFCSASDDPGLELIGLHAEIRNRRAVALTDQFRHDEARDVLIPLIENQEKLADLVGSQQVADAIGACYGSLGQIEAFTGHLDSAESFFRQALTYFEAPFDRERQWVYLGHLGCQMGGEPGEQLCSHALREITSLRDEDEPLSSGSQYVLALYLKSRLIFSSPPVLRNELQAWENNRILGNFDSEDRAHHPFGLIYQTRAMCRDRLIRSDLDVDIDHHLQGAISDYDRAIDQMTTGGPLLTLLGIAAGLRKQLLQIHVQSLSSTSPDHASLGTAFQKFRTHVQSHFGAPAWLEQEDGTATGYFGQHDPGPGDWIQRSTAVLDAIRFNYW